MANLYNNTKAALQKHFGFLKESGFPDFEEEQLAYEYHFRSSNEHVCIDLYFEIILSTPIWIAVNGYFIEHLEPENEVFNTYPSLKSACKENAERHQVANEDFIKEASEVIKRHPEILEGHLETLQTNTEIYLQKRADNAAAERMLKGIYTVEYSVFSNDDYHAYEEFDNLDTMRQFIAGFAPDTLYRILDPQMNEVKLT
ncbi:hypothetical protein [Chitinophaga silvisoli]|uniref:DUF4303 domain-containing protein n=1 Tax=Chitinophaga silvisoli TaxID=2291814 RepID=A0A3E1NZU4_9BACT|nr:hypothetical protein [Chitinophaga silvisoli]RFM33476.1 hypothetical protein DXN04_16070 [Chitinophaga silvisoli]